MLKQVIILLGQPGAGKGTQAELLAEKLNFYHFETSKILEAAFKEGDGDKVFDIEGKKYKMKDERKRWEQGLLNSPPFVAYLVQKKIRDLAQDEKSIIFSGSPRTLYEAERIFPLLRELYGGKNIKFILLEISPETTIYRNSHRKICELMRHSILYNKETENLTACPLDGSKLVKRKGLDDPEIIKTRLEQFKESTFPVVEYFKKEKVKVKKINGEPSVAEVHKDIIEAIK